MHAFQHISLGRLSWEITETGMATEESGMRYEIVRGNGGYIVRRDGWTIGYSPSHEHAQMIAQVDWENVFISNLYN